MLVQRLFFILLISVALMASACSSEPGSGAPTETGPRTDVGTTVDTDTTDRYPTPHEQGCGEITNTGICNGETAVWCDFGIHLKSQSCTDSGGTGCKDGACRNIPLGLPCNLRSHCTDELVCRRGMCVPGAPGEIQLRTRGKGRINSTHRDLNCPGPCSAREPGKTQVTLEATADPGWAFSHWEGTCDGATPTTQMTFMSDRRLECVAVFERTSASLRTDVYKFGNGLVRSQPPGIDCTDDCTAFFDIGQRVTLTAESNPGFQFTHWSGCTKFDNPTDFREHSIAFTLTADHSCTAFFQQVVDFSLEVVGPGRIQVEQGSIDCPGTCTAAIRPNNRYSIRRIPDPGARFVEWEGDCGDGDGFTLHFSDGFGDNAPIHASCKAIFEEIPRHTLTVTVEGDGKVHRVQPEGFECLESTCSIELQENTHVTLHATPAPDALFVRWKNLSTNPLEGCDKISVQTQIRLTDSQHCLAVFEPKLNLVEAWQLTDLSPSTEAIQHLVYDPNHHNLYATSVDGFVFSIEADTGRLRTEFDVPPFNGSVPAIALSPSTNSLIAAHGSHIYEWSTLNALAIPTWDAGSPLTHIALTDNDVLATSHAESNEIRLWPTRGEPHTTTLISPAPPQKLASQPGANLLASAATNEIHVWDTQTGTLKHTLDCPELRAPYNLSFSSDGHRLAAPCRLSVWSWNVENGTKATEISQLPSQFAWRPGTEHLAMLSNFSIYIHHFQSIYLRPAYLRAPKITTSLTWSADGKRLFVGFTDGTIRAYDIAPH